MNGPEAGVAQQISLIEAAQSGLSATELTGHLIEQLETRLFGHGPPGSKPGELSVATTDPQHLDWSVRQTAQRAMYLNDRLRGLLDRL